MQKKVAFIPVLVSAVFISCQPPIFEKLSRTEDDPVAEVPSVVSLVKESTITVTWTRDEASDSYIVERKEDTASSIYEQVYAGKTSSYTDYPDEGRYYYRLRKVRGTKTFEASSGALGISATVTRDMHESNDNASTANFLESDVIANMFYFKGLDGQVVSDSDWYYIELPPDSKAYVSVDDDSLSGSALTTHFMVSRPGVPEENISDLQAFVIENPDSQRKNVYFKIVPYPTLFLATATAGGSVVSYTISIESIERR